CAGDALGSLIEADHAASAGGEAQRERARSAAHVEQGPLVPSEWFEQLVDQCAASGEPEVLRLHFGDRSQTLGTKPHVWPLACRARALPAQTYRGGKGPRGIAPATNRSVRGAAGAPRFTLHRNAGRGDSERAE